MTTTSLDLLAAAAGGSGHLNPVRLFLDADIVVQAIMLGLILASVWVWTIIVMFMLLGCLLNVIPMILLVLPTIFPSITAEPMYERGSGNPATSVHSVPSNRNTFVTPLVAPPME